VGGFAWIAFPRPQISLLFLARRAHLVGLTDRRLLIWVRPHEVRQADDQDLVLDAPFSEVTLEAVHTALPLLQLRIRSSSGRRLVLEFRPRDRRVGHRIAEALGGPAAPAGGTGGDSPDPIADDVASGPVEEPAAGSPG
jgi:hypothetical protein